MQLFFSHVTLSHQVRFQLNSKFHLHMLTLTYEQFLISKSLSILHASLYLQSHVREFQTKSFLEEPKSYNSLH